MKQGSALVSLRLGHTAALPATGSHSLPRCRFATRQSTFCKRYFGIPKNFRKKTWIISYHIPQKKHEHLQSPLLKVASWVCAPAAPWATQRGR